ncbi:MAG: hypothetical protein WBQ60_02465 [Asticcacaulis sp.]
MTLPTHHTTYDLQHQQGEVLDYITEISQELAQMAERAGCLTLSYDLKMAVNKARSHAVNSPDEGNEDESPQRRAARS